MDAQRREDLGRIVREAWVKWASKQPDPKPSWLVTWDDLDAGQQEVDRQIGVAVFDAARGLLAADLCALADQLDEMGLGGAIGRMDALGAAAYRLAAAVLLAKTGTGD